MAMHALHIFSKTSLERVEFWSTPGPATYFVKLVDDVGAMTGLRLEHSTMSRFITGTPDTEDSGGRGSYWAQSHCGFPAVMAVDREWLRGVMDRY